MQKNEKKCKKLQKNLHISKKSCTFAPDLKKKPKNETKNNPKKIATMNKTYFTQSYGRVVLTTATINKNFRIKVSGNVNGERVNKLVGIRGLLEILAGDWEKLVKFVLRALNCLDDKCACKIYGGAKVTFYAK